MRIPVRAMDLERAQVREQTLQREHDVLRLASNEQLHQSLELLRVEAVLQDIGWYVLVDDLAERLEDFLPAQVRVELAEGSSQVVDAPRHLGLLVLWLLLDRRRVAILVGLESIVDDLGDVVVLPLVMDCQLEDGKSHDLLIDAAELRERLQQVVVHVRTVVADVDEHLPRLQDLVHELEVLQSAAFAHDGIRGQLGEAIRLGDVLVQGRAQRRVLAVSAGIRLQDQLLGLTELQVSRQLWNGVEEEQDSVHRVLWELLWLAVRMEFQELLAKDLQYLLEDLLIFG